MNIIFLCLFAASAVAFIILFPQNFLPTLLSAAQKAATLSLALLASYCVWMGFMQVLSDCGLTQKISKGLKPLCKKLFKTDDKGAVESLSMNISSNLLGLSGIATPYGMEAAKRLEKGKNAAYSQAMLFVLAATSLQILPNTVISLLSMYGSANPYSVILPTFLTSVLSTAIGIILVKLLVKK